MREVTPLYRPQAMITCKTLVSFIAYKPKELMKQNEISKERKESMKKITNYWLWEYADNSTGAMDARLVVEQYSWNLRDNLIRAMDA